MIFFFILAGLIQYLHTVKQSLCTWLTHNENIEDAKKIFPNKNSTTWTKKTKHGTEEKVKYKTTKYTQQSLDKILWMLETRSHQGG